MNLDHLRYFEVLAQLEHYGKAAEKLHISQPNLTYAVSQIEQELGAPLFEKAGRSIRLTRYGHEISSCRQKLAGCSGQRNTGCTGSQSEWGTDSAGKYPHLGNNACSRPDAEFSGADRF